MGPKQKGGGGAKQKGNTAAGEEVEETLQAVVCSSPSLPMCRLASAESYRFWRIRSRRGFSLLHWIGQGYVLPYFQDYS